MKDEEVAGFIAAAEGQKGVTWGQPLAPPAQHLAVALSETDVDYMLGLAMKRIEALEAQVGQYKVYLSALETVLVNARNYTRSTQ